jgi:hypothetical protein
MHQNDVWYIAAGDVLQPLLPILHDSALQRPTVSSPPTWLVLMIAWRGGQVACILVSLASSPFLVAAKSFYKVQGQHASFK